MSLTAAPALGGYARDLAGNRLRERTGLGLVAVALPRGGEAAARAAIASGFGLAMPDPGHAVHSGADWLMRLGPDQLYVLLADAGADAGAQVSDRLGDAAYVTDLSEGWVALDLAGPDARRALERICPIDLHPQGLAEGRFARTVMEHLGVLILCTGPQDYLLLSARSSALSFLHAVETSLENVL